MTLIKLLVAATLLSGTGYAMQAAAQTQQEGPLFWKAEAALLHQSDTDLSDGSGSFAIDRWFVSGGMDYVWSERNSLGFSVGGGRSSYDFDDLGIFAEGEPWDNIKEARLTLTWRFGFGDTGTMFIVPTARFNGESGSSSSDSSTYGIYAAAAWQINESLLIGPGIGVFSRLENGSRIFPILAIDWDISERWNLGTGRGLAASQGPGLALNFKLTESWTLGLAGRYEDLEFRLDDKGVAAGGVGRDQSFPLVFMASLKPSPKINLSAFAGAEFGGKLKLKNAHGDTVEKSDYDTAPIIGATFDFRF